MTLFNDLWKKFKEPPTQSPSFRPKNARSAQGASDNQHQYPEDKTAESPRTQEQVLNDFRAVALESENHPELISRLKNLKDLVDLPKEEQPELRFTQIQQNLGPEETHETVRQERWPNEIDCPNCHSKQLKRLHPLANQSPHNHRYQCLSCDTIFNDDSGTPMEVSIPPLNVWMQCWYLMGCTDSIVYIAQKLGLDLNVVEMMVDRLQKTFHAQKPLTRFMGFEDWNKQSQHLRIQLKEDLLREYELLNANVATAPKDTAEFRRQQNIRRELKPSIAPPVPQHRWGTQALTTLTIFMHFYVKKPFYFISSKYA